MTSQNSSAQQISILDEILDNATDLPVESQYTMLMLAKGMAYTHECLIKQEEESAVHKLTENYTA